MSHWITPIAEGTHLEIPISVAAYCSNTIRELSSQNYFRVANWSAAV